MTTTAHTPRRIKRTRRAGWTAPRDENGRRPVYVGRGTAWGNPYAVVLLGDGQYAIPDPIDSLASPWATFDTTRDARAEAVVLFRGWLAGRPKLIDRARTELAGRNLLCWCPEDEPCHADVLLEVANSPQCARCKDTGIDPEHHADEQYGDGTIRHLETPCEACQLQPAASSSGSGAGAREDGAK